MIKNIDGSCRVCGVYGALTVEHILPRAAGGGEKTKIFIGDEVVKAATRDKSTIGSQYDDKPYGIIKQNGFTEYTLCKSCNNHSGRHYDKDFTELYNAVQDFVNQQAQGQNIKTIEERDSFFASKGVVIPLRNFRLNNIAKRVLVAFCSIEHEGLTDRNPEIRKSIMNVDYKPDVSNFSIYLTPHIGSNGYFATIAALSNNGEIHAYAGLEIGPLAFYFASHNAHLNGGPLARCIDITNWLLDYDYNQVVDGLEIHANFEKSFMLNIPNWAFE